MSDPIQDFKIETFRKILEREIRICERGIREARDENNALYGRYAWAQLNMATELHAKFRQVFDQQPEIDDDYERRQLWEMSH